MYLRIPKQIIIVNGIMYEARVMDASRCCDVAQCAGYASPVDFISYFNNKILNITDKNVISLQTEVTYP